MAKKNAYSMSAEDKRIVFMIIGVVITAVVFITTLAALADKSWSPLIIMCQVGGTVIGTIAFFYVVVRMFWATAKRLFPDKEEN